MILAKAYHMSLLGLNLDYCYKNYLKAKSYRHRLWTTRKRNSRQICKRIQNIVNLGGEAPDIKTYRQYIYIYVHGSVCVFLFVIVLKDMSHSLTLSMIKTSSLWIICTFHCEGSCYGLHLTLQVDLIYGTSTTVSCPSFTFFSLLTRWNQNASTHQTHWNVHTFTNFVARFYPPSASFVVELSEQSAKDVGHAWAHFKCSFHFPPLRSFCLKNISFKSVICLFWCRQIDDIHPAESKCI